MCNLAPFGFLIVVSFLPFWNERERQGSDAFPIIQYRFLFQVVPPSLHHMLGFGVIFGEFKRICFIFLGDILLSAVSTPPEVERLLVLSSRGDLEEGISYVFYGLIGYQGRYYW